MRAVVFAYHDPGCEGLRALVRQGIEVSAIFTHVDDPGESIWFESVADLGASREIPVHAPDDVNHPIWVERIRALKPDVIFCFYYRRVLSPEILRIPAGGCFNLHGSLLPKYRGRCPVNWALLRGEVETGVTLHEMTERPDTGAIVAQRAFPITPEDDARSVFAKLTAATGPLLDEIIGAIRDGTAPRIPQDEAEATSFGRRRPDDGAIDWWLGADEIVNLVRAVAQPYPGAFSFSGDRKVLIWQARVEPCDRDVEPGTVVSTEPLRIACGEGAQRGCIEVRTGQIAGGVRVAGAQLAQELNLVEGMRLGPWRAEVKEVERIKTVLILGVNGFIGTALSERLLAGGRHRVFGMDLQSNNIEYLQGSPGFNFSEGDIGIHREYIEYHVRKCDIVVPLVAIASPKEYTRNPLRVFELDFEENLKVVRYCVKYGKRLIFPSTSEVYGMCTDDRFDEDSSPLVLGPIHRQRWIYSCSKQLLDRVIWAYGAQQDFKFTLFRPFNWIGPRLDSLDAARIGSSRVITQLIVNLVDGSPILLVDGGHQQRCYTDVADGVECLYRIINTEDGRCDGEVLNIGNPDNEASVRELAEVLVEAFDAHPLRRVFPPFAGYREIESVAYYGQGYQDINHRRPNIAKAAKLLGWKPAIGFHESVKRTLDFFLKQTAVEHKSTTGTARHSEIEGSPAQATKP